MLYVICYNLYPFSLLDFSDFSVQKSLTVTVGPKLGAENDDRMKNHQKLKTKNQNLKLIKLIN